MGTKKNASLKENTISNEVEKGNSKSPANLIRKYDFLKTIPRWVLGAHQNEGTDGKFRHVIGSLGGNSNSRARRDAEKAEIL